MKLACTDLDLALHHSFRIATGILEVSEDLLVTLEHEGRTGRGEAHGAPYLREDRDTVRRALQSLDGVLEGDPSAIDDTLATLPAAVRNCRAAHAAIDIALHDLAGQAAGQPLWQLLGLDPEATPVTSFTIGLDSLANMQAKVREAERYPLLKIKLGTGRDLEILDAIRAVTDKPLRADANTAWTPAQAIETLRRIEPYGVQFVEQPIPPGDPDALRRVREAVNVPIFADESALCARDIPPLAGAVDGINIKLMKCGGIAEARRMIRLARSLGLQTMLGCFIESSLGITAAAHLSPLVDHCDLDGNLFLDRDPFEGVALDHRARLILPTRPGLGVRPRSSS